jgi:hypothetical protein
LAIGALFVQSTAFRIDRLDRVRFEGAGKITEAGMGKLRWAALVGAAVSFGITGPAQAATTIGETFAPTQGCAGPITFLQTSPSTNVHYVAPSAGVITSWSYQAADVVHPIRFKVARPASVESFTTIAQSELVTPNPSSLNTYPARLPVVAGDVIGLFFSAVEMPCAALPSGALMSCTNGDPPPGVTSTYYSEETGQLDLSARLEADADSDGFGDETQDQCPSSAASQGDCRAPETTITNDVKRSDTGKAKFRFRSDEANSTFECKLKGPDLKRKLRQFRDCDSPRKYKNLDEGRFKFKVRAVDPAGNVDPTPDKDRFRVVD